MTPEEKDEQRELERMIEEVKRKNIREQEYEDFEGLD